MLSPADRLERSQWDLFWIPDDATIRDLPGLLYVTCPRDVPHLNAVTRTDPAASALEARVEDVVRAHAAVRSRWHVPSRIATSRLHDALASSGYVVAQTHDGRTTAVDRYVPRPDAGAAVVRVADGRTLRDFVQVANLAFGTRREPTDAELDAQLEQCGAPPGRVHRFVAYDGDRPVSCGGINAFDDLGLGFLWAGSTIPEARGRGFYSAVVAARIAWARTRGLDVVGLYAVTDTSSPILERQGFERCDTMTYWERPAGV